MPVSVVGHERFPDFEDRASHIYLEAIMKESLRWMTVAPLGLAHFTTEDDEFGGYFIPAGTNPDLFRSERIMRNGKLDTDVRDPSDFVFGFGRRCVSYCLAPTVGHKSSPHRIQYLSRKTLRGCSDVHQHFRHVCMSSSLARPSTNEAGKSSLPLGRWIVWSRK